MEKCDKRGMGWLAVVAAGACLALAAGCAGLRGGGAGVGAERAPGVGAEPSAEAAENAAAVVEAPPAPVARDAFKGKRVGVFAASRKDGRWKQDAALQRRLSSGLRGQTVGKRVPVDQTGPEAESLEALAALYAPVADVVVAVHIKARGDRLAPRSAQVTVPAVYHVLRTADGAVVAEGTLVPTEGQALPELIQQVLDGPEGIAGQAEAIEEKLAAP